MRFSVIIPTFNRLPLLKQAIASVQSQSFRDFEIIIIDDGSMDGTDSYLRSLPDIRVFTQNNGGPGAARNLGAKHAAGDYLAFLDSDDLWLPWTLQTFSTAIKAYRAPLLSANAQEFCGDAPTIKDDRFKAREFWDFLNTSSDPVNCQAGGMVISRQLFYGLDGFDESMPIGEDIDLYLRAGTVPRYTRILSPVTLAYRRHAAQTWTNTEGYCNSAIELLLREKEGFYPGHKPRQKDRWSLITRTTRSASMAALGCGLTRRAIDIYMLSFPMNFGLRRFRYLAGFPLCLITQRPTLT